MSRAGSLRRDGQQTRAEMQKQVVRASLRPQVLTRKALELAGQDSWIFCLFLPPAVTSLVASAAWWGPEPVTTASLGS